MTDRVEQGGDALHCLLPPDLTWITLPPSHKVYNSVTGAVYCGVLGGRCLLLSALSCRLITDRSERGRGAGIKFGGGGPCLREGHRLFVLLVC